MAALAADGGTARLTRSGTRRLELAFFLLAVLIYLPGIGWGIPPVVVRNRTAPWGTDEIGPTALSQLHTIVTRAGRYNPKYPLFDYVIQSAAIAPYVLYAGRVFEPGTDHPDRVYRISTMLARFTSVLLGAALVVIAMWTAAVLGDPRQSWIAGALTLLLLPMFYYARTSNVDMAAMCFTGVALWQYATCLRGALTMRTALLLGGAAALAVATKDASYGAMLPAGVVVAILHWRRERRLVMMAAAVAIVVYLAASGLVVNWASYLYHVRFTLTGSTRHYGFYYGSTRSYALVLADTLRFVVEAMSVPLAVLAAAGLVLSVRGDRRLLLWALPAIGIVALTVLPVRFVVYRYAFGVAYCLVFFAAAALSSLRVQRPRVGRVVIALVCGWSLLRGGDLTWQMLNDSRYEAGKWFARNARAGDRVGYYGTEPEKLPFLSGDVDILPGPATLPASDPPEFLVVLPWQDYETVHEYNLPEETYLALRAGTAGYRQMLGLKSPALFPSKPGTFLNPSVKVFVRTDRAASLVDSSPRIETAD